jgi:hypothetical protein
MVKYDDASWHYNEKFPKDSPRELSGTHIALLLKWCFVKGWAGDLHLRENPSDVEALRHGNKSATEFLFQWCDGKFTDEDLSETGNAFISKYYGKGGAYFIDYATKFGDLMFVAPEGAHDFDVFSSMAEARYKSYVNPTEPVEPPVESNTKPTKPWWRRW